MPSQASLSDFYSNDYEVHKTEHLASVRRHKGMEVSRILNGQSPGKLLEIGCSWGFFLDAARKLGWEAHGVELSQPAAQWGRDNLALTVFSGTLEHSPYVQTRSFDLVVASHVIEHMPNPMSFLDLVNSCLKPGGRLVLKTPNIVSLPARLNGEVWEWFGAPAHLVLFSPRGVAKVLDKAGFEVALLETRRGDAHNPWFEALRGLTRRVGIHRSAKRIIGVHTVGPIHDQDRGHITALRARRINRLRVVNRIFDVAFAVCYPIERALEKAGLGAELIVVATRR